jgi:8-oxo-dGTP diphosphatase
MPRRAPRSADSLPSVAEIAAGAVVRLDGTSRVLLLHQKAGDRWCLPKGHVERGESLADAARRETREESGLGTVSLGPPVAEVHYRFVDPRRQLAVHKTVVYFVASTPDARASPERIFDDFRWVTFPEARRLVRFETDRQALRAAENAAAGRSQPRRRRRLNSSG